MKFYEDINSKIFWKMRNQVNQIKFNFKKFSFNKKKFSKEFKMSFFTNIYLMRNIAVDVIVALLYVILILSFENIVMNYFIGLLDLGVYRFLAEILSVDSSAFVLLLGTLASITGVFLSLYFSSIGNIIGGSYSQLPKELSLIFENEKIGNKYIRSLMRFILVCLLLLALSSMGIDLNYVVIATIMGYGSLSIMNFINLGKYIFRYSDITEISNNIYRQINESAELASIKGFGWDDANFQNHYYGICKKQIYFMSMLVKIVVNKEKKQDNSLLKLFRKCAFLLFFYQQNYKSRIPSNSRWFPNEPKYNSWFAADSTTLDIALSTGTFIQPSMLPDYIWFEVSVFEILSSIIEHVLENSDFEKLNSMVIILQRDIDKLIVNLEIKETIEIISDLTGQIYSVIDSCEVSTQKVLSRKDDRLITLDQICALYTGIIIGINKRIDIYSSESLESLIERVEWTNKESIYQMNLPFSIMSKIEKIQAQLNFEKDIESVIFESNWYLKQIIGLEYVRELEMIASEAIALFNNQFCKYAVSYHNENKYMFSYIFIYSGITCYMRTKTLLRNLERIYKGLEKNKIEPNIPWVEIDFSKLNSELTFSYNELIKVMAKTVPILALEPKNDKFPDLFGHGYNYLLESCFNAILDNDKELFYVLYSELTKVTLIAGTKISQDLETYDERFRLVTTINSAVDFVAISGHAIFYSELTGDFDLRDFVFSESDRILSSVNDVNDMSVYERILKMCEFEDSIFEIHQRQMIRISWTQRMDAYIRESGLITKRYEPARFYETIIDHSSPLVRSFTYELGSDVPFHELYICLYLNAKVSEGKQFKTKWGWKERYLREVNEGGCERTDEHE
ncbi:hypothetical protein IZY60_13240 [Lutibacter sp. B2]|nr:hypothetical protein [Lutibacter sp. B2]